ncbi:MAG: galactokinase [Cellulosilyticaceae bacterium]
MFNHLHKHFEACFNKAAEHIFFAPGRINLIGEHIDYNGGLVFPCPITLGTYALVSPRQDQCFKVYSTHFEDLGILSFDLNNLVYDPKHSWANYIKGVMKFLTEDGHTIPHGLDILVHGNIPNGAGLSSSASLEMLSAHLLTSLFHLDLAPVQMALLGKKVENDYMGVNSGIMDQFAIGLGQKDHALLLDCNTLEYKPIPLNLEGYQIVIMNTNKRRELADSKYNERREQCENALARLQAVHSAHHLCDFTPTQLDDLRDILQDKLLFKRMRHAVTEHARVKTAAHALMAGDLQTFGLQLSASHQSLKEDYDVTGIELDTLVSAAQTQPGVLGARMTGAGFGGCALAIVADTDVSTFITNVGRQYLSTIGYEASFYVAAIGNGPTEIHF